MANIVLVHGGWHGGWSYKKVAKLLRQAGHEVYTPTLTGLGERSHLAAMPINLDTHITDITNTILWEGLSDVVLVGHSYGGMVITGVADRVSDRISALVYLDAIVPEDGDTLVSRRPEFLDPFLAKVDQGGGLMVPPPAASAYDTSLPEDWAWIDGKSTPHPFACFVQAIRLTGREQAIAKRVYVYAVGGILDGEYTRFETEAGARIIAIESSCHSMMIDSPERVAEILIETTQP
jgi:pimeloyl-ACP methyl ester carboxylesterase